MFHIFAERSFPALIVMLGFALVAYGTWALGEADRQYAFQTNRMIQDKVNQDLAEEYGAFAYRRIRDEDMSPAELKALHDKAREELFATHGEELELVYEGDKNAAILRLVIGTVMMCFAFWRYGLAFRRKRAAKKAQKNKLSA